MSVHHPAAGAGRDSALDAAVARDIPPAPDVVVMGGGVAGATAATLLATWGHLVLLVEREVSRPPLAESLPPSCIPLLETIGVRRAVDAAGFVRGAGNTVWWGGEPMRVEPYAGGRSGYQVERARLEEVLTACAIDAGAVRVHPATALRVTRERDGDIRVSEVELSLASGRCVVRAPWVLDCTGRSGVLARAVRVAPPPDVRTVALIGVWTRRGGWVVPNDTHTLVESGDWGWGWSIPVSPEARYFTAMVDPRRTRLEGGGGITARYDALLSSLSALGAIARAGSRTGEAWACEATPYHSRDVASRGALLVGDAASAIDPLSSFGVKKALASAWLASVTVHTALVAPDDTDAALTLFRERETSYARSAATALGALSRQADAGHAAPFWSARGEADSAEVDEGALVERLRGDPAVQRAFQTLRERSVVRFEADGALERVPRPVVRGNVIVNEPHLRLSGCDLPVRYLRNVDLLAVRDLARGSGDVGAMYEHYARTFGRVALPDFLGALSVLVAKGALRVASAGHQETV